MLKYLYLSLMLLFCTPHFAMASQNMSEETDTTSTVKFADRISIHTNTLGWLLMTPNFGVEYDFVHNKHKKVSLLLSGKFNGQTNQKFDSRYVYNIAGAKAELRWYFRTRKIDDLGEFPEERIKNGDYSDFQGPWERERVEGTTGFLNKLWNSRRLVTAKKNPRRHRAYYVGPYAAYDKFSIKFTETGYQGSAIGAGLTFGYSAPLYIYNNGDAIDFEIGAGVGALLLDYDTYGYNGEDKCYTTETTGESTILPMLSDLRLSLVYRFDPIQEQAYEVNYDKLVKERHYYNLRKRYMEEMDTLVLSDSVKELYSRYNKEVYNYNKVIADYNRQILKHEDADSADLLIEKAPLFDFVSVPQKILNFGSKKMLPNRDISSVEELDVDLLNKFSRDLRQIGELQRRYNTPVASVDTLIINSYRTAFSPEDTLKQETLSYYEYILALVPAINKQSIMRHNETIFAGADAKTMAIDDTLRVAQVVGLPQHLQKLTKTTDYYLLESPINFALSSKNDEVESDNWGKVETINKKYGIDVDLEILSKEEKRQREKAKIQARKEQERLEKELNKEQAKAAKEELKAAKEKAKQEAAAAKEQAKLEKEQAKATAEAAAEQAAEQAGEKVEAATENLEEAGEKVAEAAEKIQEADEKAEENMTKEQAKAAKELKKQQEKAAKEKAKAEAKARKEQEKLEKELKKQQEKAAKEAAKAEAKARKEQEELEKEQSKNSDAQENKNENSDEE